MALIPKTNIATGNTILASDITNIINSLDGTGSYTVIATGSFSGSFTGLATSASYASTASYVENAQTASYVTLAQTASYVENAQTASFVANAQTASLSTSTPFAGITGLPDSLSGYGGFGGVSIVKGTVVGAGQIISVNTLNNGAFYPIDANGGTVTYDVDVPGGGTTYGFEVTLFAIDGTNSISFSPSASITIINKTGNPSFALTGTGAKATLKYISSNTWACFGDIV